MKILKNKITTIDKVSKTNKIKVLKFPSKWKAGFSLLAFSPP